MLRNRWMTYEHACAIKSPVMEAEYAHDDTTALSMYDCLIPKLREWRKFRIRPEIKYKEMLVQDMKAHQRVLELEFKLQEKLLPGLQAENKELKEKVKELEHEAVMVKWFKQILEPEIAVKANDIIRKYEELQKEHATFQ